MEKFWSFEAVKINLILNSQKNFIRQNILIFSWGLLYVK